MPKKNDRISLIASGLSSLLVAIIMAIFSDEKE